jgi:hypothetical protein
MTQQDLKLLIETMGHSLVLPNHDPDSVVRILIRETIRFRDKLKEETGQILTVGDTREALEALEEHLKGYPPEKKLTPEQRALAQIYIDRLTFFNE